MAFAHTIFGLNEGRAATLHINETALSPKLFPCFVTDGEAFNALTVISPLNCKDVEVTVAAKNNKLHAH
jgi:hypothetical protein